MFDYESPIKVLQDEIRINIENEIMKAACNVGVLVDKDELLKALKYDREQYEKGYRDGLNASKWIPVSERLPEEKDIVMCTEEKTGRIYTGWFLNIDDVGHRWFDCEGFSMEVVAWMPLPVEYKEEGAE